MATKSTRWHKKTERRHSCRLFPESFCGDRNVAAPWISSQSQRDCVLQPRVARNELPWVQNKIGSYPKGVVSGHWQPFCHPERSRGISAVSGIVSPFEILQQQQSSLGFARGDNPFIHRIAEVRMFVPKILLILSKK